MSEQGPPTLSVTWHLTHNCNLRCRYCYTGAKFGSGMTAAVADKAVAFSLAEADRPGVAHLETVFFGGEPLLRMDLLCSVVDRIRAGAGDRRTSFKMSTNGTLVTGPVVEELRKREVYVSISLDGDPDTQDSERPDAQGRGTSKRLQEAIDLLLDWNPCTSVNCVVTPRTADRVDRSMRWLYERGFKYLSSALDYSAEWTTEDLAVLQASYERLADWYVAETLRGRKFYLSSIDEKIRTRTRGPLDRAERCSIGWRQFSISPSGRLYPCVQFVKEDNDPSFVLGDVFSGFTEEKRRWVSSCSEGVKPECDGCALLDRCSSWCACVNWTSTGSLERASPVVCAHDQMLMRIADAAANRLWKRRNHLFIHKHYNPAFPVLSFIEDVIVKEAAREQDRSR
jgi:uncharacterized protein